MQTMTADEYQRTVCVPARKEADAVDPWLNKIASVKVCSGYAVFEGKRKVKEVNGPWDKKPIEHIEDDHTEMVAGYLELLRVQGKVIEYTHTANETYTRSPMQKARNTRMGVRSGIPDFVIVFPRQVLFLELKRPKGGVVSKTQKVWIEAIKRVGGTVACEVANGFDEARVIIDNQIKLGA